MKQECVECRQILDVDEFRRDRRTGRLMIVCNACELEAKLKKIYARRRRRREEDQARALSGRACLGEGE